MSRSYQNKPTPGVGHISAFASPEIRKEAEHFNIADYPVKPVSSEEIVKKIESSLT